MKKADFARTNPIPIAVVVAGPTHRTTSELKLRKGAGRHYATQCILAEGSEVYLLRISGLWASVQHQQNFGWLPAQCLERLSVVQAVTPPIVRAPKPAPVIARGFTPRSAASPAEPADDDFIPTHRSTADLNLRKGSGTNYPVLRVLAADVLVRKLDEAGTWTKVATGQDTGWVPSAYLEQVNIQRPATGIQSLAPVEFTTTVRLNVRTGVGDQYPVMRILQAGTMVRVNGSLGAWRRIVIDQEQGWVPASQLQPRYLSSTTPVTAVQTTLYQGASANYRALTQINAGEELLAIANRGQWTKVQYGRFNGWVNTSHLR